VERVTLDEEEVPAPGGAVHCGNKEVPKNHQDTTPTGGRIGWEKGHLPLQPRRSVDEKSSRIWISEKTIPRRSWHNQLRECQMSKKAAEKV